MSRTNRLLGGITFGYANQAIATVVAFWLTPFLLHRVGQHSYGLWLVGAQLIAYLGLLDFGVVALLPRETAFATGRASTIEEASDLPVMIGHTVRIILWQLPLVALAAFIAWFMMPSEWADLRHPIGVVLLAFVVLFPLRIFGAVLSGLQDLAFVGRLNIISYLIGAASTVGLILAGCGLYALAVGWAVVQLTTAIGGWLRLRTRFPTVLPRILPPMPWSIARKRLTQGGWVSLSQIAQVLLNGTDMLIIGKLFGPAAVVPFAITGKLVNVLSNQPQLLMAAAVPALSQMRIAESRERLAEVCIALSQATLILSGAVVCVVLAVNQGFVGRWVGAGQYGGSLLTGLILLSMLLRHWNLTMAYALLCFGFERRLCVTALLDGVVSVGAVLFFVRVYGLIGAPMGMITGACLVSLPANIYALARESNMSVLRLIQPLLPWFLRFAFLSTSIVLLARIWIPNTFLRLGLTAAVTGTIYVALMFPLALRSPLGDYVRPRLFPIRARVFRLLRVNSYG